jgi:two-component system cell cycle sensor histidine kinase/response regulator CckA
MPAGDSFLERELKEAREREADYRTRLARHRELALRLRAHAARLREVLREAGPGRIERLLLEAARLSSQALEIPRASLWLFDETRERLVRRFELPERTASVEYPLDVANCAAYIHALKSAESGAIAVSDALTDARTSELSEYLLANDVRALLDVPLVGPGALYGVLCHEHQGAPRVWQEEEIDFATDVGALVSLALEVERRSSLERSLRGSEARYQHLVEALPVAVYSFDARTGRLDYLSPRIRELAGRSAEEYLVSGGIERWVDAIDVEDRTPVQKRLSGDLSGELAGELVYRVRLPDGSRRFVRDTCSIVRDAHGQPVAVQGTLADVTAQKESELARAEVEARHRALLENADLPAVILDRSGRVEFINECLLRVTGYSAGEVIGADGFELLLAPSERARLRKDFLEGMARGKLMPRMETRLRTRTGAERRVLWTNTVMHDASGAVIGCSSLGVDITDRLEAEALALQLDKLESLGRLAAGVAHDFNNLLTVISGATDSLARSVRASDAQPLEDIQLAVTQAAGLTRALLAYARREKINPTLVAADSIVEGTLPMLQKLVAPRLELSSALDAPDAKIVIDTAQLRQVLMNLVGNAVDATLGHGSGVRITTCLVTLEAEQVRTRGLAKEGTFWLLSVADDGRGMTPENVERAFDPFFTTKQNGEGTGLGLAMCNSIVRRAGGFIVAESAPRSGATFRVYLPIAESR